MTNRTTNNPLAIATVLPHVTTTRAFHLYLLLVSSHLHHRYVCMRYGHKTFWDMFRVEFYRVLFAHLLK